MAFLRSLSGKPIPRATALRQRGFESPSVFSSQLALGISDIFELKTEVRVSLA